MYTENNNGGLLKNIILKLLFIALFIFLLLWLYPMPNTKPFYDSIFNDNIMMMKDVAEEYYTVQRLPKEVGEKDKLTLKQMLDKKLLLPFVDKNGEYCDYEKSYVEVTKLENDEYELKVNLSCKDQSDYIIVYLGCHDLCVDGKCETVVSVLEYKFTRELVRGRKPVKVDLYKYEYSKSYKEAYTVDKQVTYYKGNIKVSDDVYKYEYTKPFSVPYDVTTQVTYYKGRKQISPDVYSYEYTRQVPNTTTTQVTYYKGRKQISPDVYSYEYTRQVPNTTTSCKTYYNQSSVPSGASNVTSSTQTVKVADGYEYGPWRTFNTITTPYPNSYSNNTDTYREYLASTTTVTNTTCSSGKSCPSTKKVYIYYQQNRTKTKKYKDVKTTTYNYQICTTSGTTYTPQTTWSTATSLSGWTRTGQTRLESAAKYDETDWVTSLPAGYTKFDQKIVPKTETTYIPQTTWSTATSLSGWTRTGQTRLESAAKYDETDWVTSLPAGYTKFDQKTEPKTEVKYETEIKKQWSIEDLTKDGWTKTNNKELVSKGSYIETGWVTSLPAGYTQIAKETRTEKEVKYKTITKKQWSAEDLTKDGWTKTGNKEKIGQTTGYEYTKWVTKLPAGYEQFDKKTEEKWSTEDLTKDGWTKTKDTRVKEDK